MATFQAGRGNEVPGLTALRGIAASFVCLMHLTNAFPRLGIAQIQMVDRAWLAVELFLIMSGFIIHHAYGRTFAQGVTVAGWSDFLVSRLARIWPLAAVALLLAVLLHLLATGDPTIPHVGPRSLATAAETLVLLNGFFPAARWNYPSWSLTAEMLNYLLAPFLIAAIRLADRRTLLLAAAGCLAPVALVDLAELLLARDDGRILLTFGGHWLLLQGPARPFLDFVHGPPIIGRCLPLFVLGAILARFHAEGWLRPLASGRTALAAGLLVLASIQLTTLSLLTVLAFLLLIGSVASGGGRLLLESAPLRWLGEVSFGIYMLHAPLQLALYDLLDRFGVDHAELGWSAGLPLLILLLGLVLASAHLGWRLVERPARRALRTAWTARRTPAPAMALG